MTAPTMEQMLDYLGMCERAMHITGMEESCFVSRCEELTRARNAVLARFAELERERDAYRALAEQAEATLRTCGCDMNADMIRREIAQRAGETG